MLAKTLADRVRQLREEKGWSQGQLTTYSGVSKGQVSKIEKGDRKYPSASVIMKLAKALGTTTDYLLGLTDDPRKSTEQDYKAVAEGIDDLAAKIAEIKRHLEGDHE